MVLSAKQREARATRVGASEVAALMDEHPYLTEADVYDRIVDGVTREPTINMQVGAYLEPYVLRMARDLLGLRLRACSRSYVHPTLPLCASLDAYEGKNGVADVKVTGAWNDGVPRYVWWQLQTQMLLSGRDHGTVIVLAGSSLAAWDVEKDWDACVRLVMEVKRFNEQHLVPRVRPVTPPFVFKE